MKSVNDNTQTTIVSDTVTCITHDKVTIRSNLFFALTVALNSSTRLISSSEGFMKSWIQWIVEIIKQ